MAWLTRNHTGISSVVMAERNEGQGRRGEEESELAVGPSGSERGKRKMGSTGLSLCGCVFRWKTLRAWGKSWAGLVGCWARRVGLNPLAFFCTETFSYFPFDFLF